jgi:hypothetical protein
MTVTYEEWETELESVEQVTARDTLPAPPPSEHPSAPPVILPRPPPHCVVCFADLTQTDHEPACPQSAVIA